MSDPISRQTAIDALKDRYYKYGRFAKLEELVWVIEKLPSAEPAQKTGKWAYKTTDAYIQRTCSACGWSERMYYRNRNQDGLIRNFCPNCGTKMKGEQNE